MLTAALRKCGLPAATAVAALLACGAVQASELEWQTVCSGRMTLSIPVPAEIAASPSKNWRSRLVGGRPAAFEFPDGEQAYGAWAVFGSWIRVTHPLDSKVKSDLLVGAEHARQRLKQGAGDFKDLPLQARQGVSWEIDGTKVATLALDDHLVDWSERADAADAVERDRHYLDIVKGTKLRSFAEIPAGGGVCLPYVFVPDDGRTPYEVRMAFRPKNHPDITILLADASPSADSASHSDTRRRVDEFWSQYGKVKSVWPSPYHQTQFAGQEGLESFVVIERSDGAQDYGFLAIGTGGPGTDARKPDLMLYVIRDAKHAKLKGIEPVGRDDLLKMAQAIASSVRARASEP